MRLDLMEILPRRGREEAVRMIICHCKGLSDREIRKGLSANGSGLPPTHLTPAGTGCGGCLPAIRELLAAQSHESPRHRAAQKPRAGGS